MKLSSKHFLLRLFVFLSTSSFGVLLWWNLYAAPLPDSLVPPVRLSTPNIVITDADKMEIIASILSQYRIMRYKPMRAVTPKLLYLSTTNLPAPAFDNFPKIGEMEIILLLVSQADKNKPLPTYAEFREFEVKGDVVKISLITEFNGGNMSGGHYEYKKIGGQWQVISKNFSAAAS